MRIATMKAKSGIWTPWARVVCYECHGPTFKNRDYDPETGSWHDRTLTEEQWEQVRTELEVDEGKRITSCDKCGQKIQVDDSIAAEHNMASRLKEAGIDASMAQTGGMCSACEINVADDDGWYYATYNFDGDEKWWICQYDKEGALRNYDDNFTSISDDEAFNYITGRDDVKRL